MPDGSKLLRCERSGAVSDVDRLAEAGASRDPEVQVIQFEP